MVDEIVRKIYEEDKRFDFRKISTVRELIFTADWLFFKTKLAVKYFSRTIARVYVLYGH